MISHVHIEHLVAHVGEGGTVGEQNALDLLASHVALRDDVRSICTDACQILDVVKGEWSESGSWSEWDQSVRDRISVILQKLY